MKSKEWNGEGMPPIGTVCEYLWIEEDEWRKCEVVAHHFKWVVACVLDSDSVAVFLHHNQFRPIKTPEQIEEEGREEAIEDMYETVINRGNIKQR